MAAPGRARAPRPGGVRARHAALPPRPRLRDVRVAYGSHVALDGATLVASPHSVRAVVGGDGAGKTTLLRVLVGVLAPQSGTVARPAKQQIGYMSGAPGVYGDLSVLDNLTFVGTAFGLARRRLARRVEHLLERTQLTDARDRLGAQLSGGMRQKLALAMALLHDPPLLVLDEPTTGVDPVSRRELWRLIGQAASDGAAVVLSTAYLDEAERAAWVLVLAEGVPVASGDPADIVAGVPGAVFEVSEPWGPRELAWRRGARWRAWSPDGTGPPGVAPAELDLEDALVVLALARARGGGEAAA